MHAKRLLFIGLDAGDAELIDRWCVEGRLPHIARMKAMGTSFRMRTTAEVFHVSAWPSIFTGTGPDQHGLYHAYVTHPGHQGVLRPKPDQSPFPFVWKTLDDAGRRSVVMDAFMTCPLDAFNGVQIVDWGTWSWFWQPTVTPQPIAREFKRRFGRYPSDDHSKVGIVPVTDVAAFRQRLLAAVARKTEALKWLIQQQQWALFLVVFGECHPAGHYFWHLHDPSYHTHPGASVGDLTHALRDVYVALDGAIGELLAVVGDDTTVWLVSGDGMTGNFSGSHLLEPMLAQMGLMQRATAERTDGTAAAAPSSDLLRTIRDLVPQRIRMTISKALLTRHTQEQLALRWKTSGIAWPSTRAFIIENANEGYVRINLKGREPQGAVSPGEEYERLCDLLCRTARGLANPATGLPAARAVYKTDDLFDGPFRSHMPDVIICWNRDARITTELLAQECGLVRVPAPSSGTAPFYSGNHWPNAFVIATGPGIDQGVELHPRHVLDLAPTILSAFDIRTPVHMTGEVVPELRTL
jgi:predicted AlkP superfamily phosphohydrolase/phosphomutase